MKYRYIGILGGEVGHYKTHPEALAFITSIPGMRGVIIDREQNPENDDSENSDLAWRKVEVPNAAPNHPV